MRKIDLRRLILLLALTTGVVTFINGLFASYLTQRDLLMTQALEANRAYAAKQAHNTDNFIRSAQAHLTFSAQQITTHLAEPDFLQAEVDRLRLQSNDFNSAIVVEADGQVLATSPPNLGLAGTRLQSSGAKAILGKHEPVITDPYIGSTGRLLIVMSHPIIRPNGDYLGYISTSIYLKEKNILNAILDESYRDDGSYTYVVDRTGKLIYHPDPSRTGEDVSANEAVQLVLDGKESAIRLNNLKGIDMLAGFAQMKTTGWGLVAQKPTQSTLSVLDRLMLDTLLQTAPLSILTLLGIWWLSLWIALPLRKLALNAQAWEKPEALEQFKATKTWYYEADQLKLTLVSGFSLLQQRLGKLSQDNITDPLTGLNNRRGLRLALDSLLPNVKGMSVVTLDIDHFKQVNDQHGHNVGDEVLMYLAQHMRQSFRSDDILCRVGGEEFLVLLPGMSLDAAHAATERLRQRMTSQPSPSGDVVTISAGIAYLPEGSLSVDAVLKASDAALYAAKGSGRNCVISTLPLAAQNEEH
jgi:diguanylate cyclase (GGDEF)-like protein